MLGKAMDRESRQADIIAGVTALAQPVLQELGLELFELEFKAGNPVLRVFIDRPGGSVSIDDCALVSGRLSLRLDESDLIPWAYRLEVSSPGLDRPLRREEDYRRFCGRLARLWLSQPLGGRLDYVGRIGEFHQGMVKLQLQEQESIWVPLTQIKKARLEVELKRQPRP
jgi:ribosome maturation factor RimP